MGDRSAEIATTGTTRSQQASIVRSDGETGVGGQDDLPDSVIALISDESAAQRHSLQLEQRKPIVDPALPLAETLTPKGPQNSELRCRPCDCSHIAGGKDNFSDEVIVSISDKGE
jgi:hypothetical protein